MNEKRIVAMITVAISSSVLMISGCAQTGDSVTGDGTSRSAGPESAPSSLVKTPDALRALVDASSLTCEQDKVGTWTSAPGDAFKLPVGTIEQRSAFEWPLTQAGDAGGARAMGVRLDSSGWKDVEGNPVAPEFGDASDWRTKEGAVTPFCLDDASEAASVTGYQLATPYAQSGFRIQWPSSKKKAKDGVQCLTINERNQQPWSENCTDGYDRLQTFFWQPVVGGIATAWKDNFCITARFTADDQRVQECGLSKEIAARQKVVVQPDGRLVFPGAKTPNSCATMFINQLDTGELGLPQAKFPCDKFSYPPAARGPAPDLLTPIAGGPKITTQLGGSAVPTTATCSEAGVYVVGCRVTGLLAPEVEGDLRAGMVSASYWNLPLVVGVVNKAPGLVAVSGEEGDFGNIDTPAGDPLGTHATGAQRVGVVKPTTIPYNGTAKLPFLREMTGASLALSASAGEYTAPASPPEVTVDKNKVKVRIATTASSAKDMEQCLKTSKVGSKAWSQNCGFVDVTIKSGGGSVGSDKVTQVEWTCEVAGVSDTATTNPNFKRISVDFIQGAKGDRSSLGAAGFLDPTITVNAARSGVGRECKSRESATGEIWWKTPVPQGNGGN